MASLTGEATSWRPHWAQKRHHRRRCRWHPDVCHRSLDGLEGTVEHLSEEFLDVEATLGGDLPGVNVELVLVLASGPLGGHLPLVLEIRLVAHHHQRHFVQVDVFVCLTERVLASLSHDSTSTQDCGQVMSYTISTPLAPLQYTLLSDLQRSCPAVSQRVTFMVLLRTFTTLERNSTPTVAFCPSLNQLRMQRVAMLVLPVLVEPITTILNISQSSSVIIILTLLQIYQQANTTPSNPLQPHLPTHPAPQPPQRSSWACDCCACIDFKVGWVIIIGMRNKICDKVELEKVVAQYIHKNRNKADPQATIQQQSLHPTDHPADHPIDQPTDQFRRTLPQNIRVFSKTYSHRNAFLDSTRQKFSLPSKLDGVLIEVKMPLTSRLFSHENESGGVRKEKQLRSELLQTKKREFYGRANLRIRQLKRQQKREQLAQNEKFGTLFSHTFRTLGRETQKSLSKTFDCFHQSKSTEQQKLRVNNTIVVLRQEKVKAGFGKSGLEFYKTLFK